MNFVGLGFAFKARDEGVVDTLDSIHTRLDSINASLGRTDITAKRSFQNVGSSAGAALGSMTAGAEKASAALADTVTSVTDVGRNVAKIVDPFLGAIDASREFQDTISTMRRAFTNFVNDAGIGDDLLTKKATEAKHAHEALARTLIESVKAQKKAPSARTAAQDLAKTTKAFIDSSELLKGADPVKLLRDATREANHEILEEITERKGALDKATDADVLATKAAIKNARLIARNRKELNEMLVDVREASAPGAYRQAAISEATDRFKSGKGGGAAGGAGAIRNMLFGGDGGKGILPVAKGIFDKIGDFSARPGIELRKELDTFETQVRGRLGASAQDFQNLQEVIVKTADATGVQDSTLIDLNKQLLQAGFSVKELGQSDNDFVKIGADFISTMGMSTEQVASFITAAKSTGVGKDGFKRMANEATRLERSFGTLGLVEEFPELMVSARKNAIALGKDFTGSAEKSAVAAAKMGLVIKTQINGNIKDAIAASRGISETFADVADDIAATMGGLQDDFGPTTQGLQEVFARVGVVGQNFFHLMNEAATDPEKGLPKIADALAAVMDRAKDQPALFGRYRIMIKRALGPEMAKTVMTMARSHQTYDDVLKAAEEDAKKNNRQVKDGTNAQKESADVLKGAFAIQERMLQNTKANVEALSITRAEMAAMKSGVKALNEQLGKMVDKLVEIHKASATDGKTFFDSQTAGWTAVGVAASGAILQIAQIPGVMNVIKSLGGAGLRGLGGTGIGATSGAFGLPTSGLGASVAGAAGIALLVNAIVAMDKGLDKRLEVLNATGDSGFANLVGLGEFGKQFYTQFPEWLDKQFGTSLAGRIKDGIESLSGEKLAKSQLEKSVQADVARYAQEQDAASMRKAVYGGETQERIDKKLATFKTDPTARKEMLNENVWAKISDTIQELDQDQRHEYRKLVMSGKVVPPALRDKIEQDVADELVGERHGLLRKIGDPRLASQGTPLVDLRAMAAESDRQNFFKNMTPAQFDEYLVREHNNGQPLLKPNPNGTGGPFVPPDPELSKQLLAESSADEILGGRDLDSIIRDLKSGKQDASSAALQNALEVLLMAIEDLGDRLKPEVTVELKADSDLLRRALSARNVSDEAIRGRPSRLTR